ncbi:helix-turn-helix domain-containing protein [Micromonospora qiuiae]|uniref:helix-turn-helix domain-containing protein n=1 Tax=Micromonospora qiuiae TaxID=502268 RepID=UPI0035570833
MYPTCRSTSPPLPPATRGSTPGARGTALRHHPSLVTARTCHEGASVLQAAQPSVRCRLRETPLAYLTMLRMQEMARLLAEPEMPIAEAGRRVGWQSRNRATEAFREHSGVIPTRS